MRALTLLAVLFFVSGCASRSLETARYKFQSGDADAALTILEDCEQTYAKDRLLCFMEKGSILFFAKRHKESSEVLLKASQLMVEQDQISLIDQSTAVVVSDRTMEYKGEFAERLWVHTFQMMNFLLLDQIEKALVEARQALEIYDRYPRALTKAYFSRALIALCYENLEQFDDAKIEYNQIPELLENIFLPPPPPSADSAEVVFFISGGTIPRKISHEIVVPPSVRISLPAYGYYLTPPVVKVCSEKIEPFLTVSSDLGFVAIMSLKERVAEYVTRQAIRVGVKESIAQLAEQQDDLAGVVARLILFIAEQADTRSWQTLPGRLTISRLKLRPGSSPVSIYSESGQLLSQFSISVKGGYRQYYFLSL